MRPHSTSSFCICPADFTARGMCVCGRGREFANTNRASAISFNSYREVPTRDRDEELSPRVTTPSPGPEEEGNSSMSTEIARADLDFDEEDESETLRKKKFTRRHRAYFFTHDGINLFLRAGMIGRVQS